MDASLITEMKDMAEQNRRLKKMYAEMSMQNDLLKEALGKKALRPSRRREMAMNAVVQRGTSIALACRTFQITETCYRYRPVRSDENEEIADWLERLTENKHTWVFGCVFYICATCRATAGTTNAFTGLL